MFSGAVMGCTNYSFGDTLYGNATSIPYAYFAHASSLQLFPKKCGSCIGWHSANKICGGAHGKPMG